MASDFAFARPPDLSATSEETTESQPSSAMVPLELEETSPPPSNHNQAWAKMNANGPPHNQAWATAMSTSNAAPKKKGPLKIKALGKKLGGALQKINNTVNIAKWIDDLEQDQHLADRLDRINSDNAEEEERKEICREAMEACLKAMRDHLMEFLDDHPQATYEEWICNLHPDNINGKLDGLTQTPMIDHRFYVQSSDHRILWNENLNDLNDPMNLTPVRHFVEARTFLKKPSVVEDGDTRAPAAGEDFFSIINGQDAYTPSTTQQTDLFEEIGEGFNVNVNVNTEMEQTDPLGVMGELFTDNTQSTQQEENQGHPQPLQQQGDALDLLSM
jgi:hypothetical protein